MRVKMSRIRLRIDLGLADRNELPARVGSARRPLLAPPTPLRISDQSRSRLLVPMAERSAPLGSLSSPVGF